MKVCIILLSRIGRNGFRLLSAQSASELGDWFTYVALILIIYNYSHNAFLVGLIFIVQEGASLIASFIGIGFVDRLNPKLVMIVTDIVRGAVICAIPWSLHNYIILYVLIGIEIFIATFYSSSKHKVVGAIGDVDKITLFNSVSLGISATIKIVGPFLAGLIVITTSPYIPFYLDGLSFLLSALITTAVLYTYEHEETVDSIEEDSEEGASDRINTRSSFLQNIADAVKVLRDDNTIRSLLFVFILGSFMSGLFITQLVVLNGKILHGTDLTFSLLNSASAIGLLLASIIIPFILKKIHPYRSIVWLTFLGIGISLISLTLFPLPVDYVVMIFLGLFQGAPNLIALILCQTMVRQDSLGRFFLILHFTTTPFYLIGMVVAGLVSSSSVLDLYRFAGVFGFVVFTVFMVLERRVVGGAVDVQESSMLE